MHVNFSFLSASQLFFHGQKLHAQQLGEERKKNTSQVFVSLLQDPGGANHIELSSHMIAYQLHLQLWLCT